MNNTNNKRKIIFIIAALLLIAVLLFMLPSALNKQGKAAENGDNGGGSAENSEPEAVIFCASDYQIEDGFPLPAETLSSLLHSAVTGLSMADSSEPDNDSEISGAGISGLIYCGDYTNDLSKTNYELSPDESIAEIRRIAAEKAQGLEESDMVFVQGNHDAMSDSVSESGLHEFDDYLVYVLNTERDFPWKQGKVSGALKKVKASSDALRECLKELADRGEARPLIIAGHVPLHFTARTSSRHTTGDNLYSSLIFDAVNEYADSLDIIYLYGHNHSKGWDCYMGGSTGFLAPGDTILIPEFEDTDLTTDSYTKETLNFTYFNAGYTGYYMNCGPDELASGTWHDYDAADTALTATTIEIYGDRLVITRWDADGMHNIRGEGTADPYKGGIDSGLIPEELYAAELTGPQVIIRH